MASHLCHKQGISSAPRGQWAAMACFSTSFGVLKGFMHPCHSHKNGKLGLGFGIGVTDVTVRLEVDAPGVIPAGFILRFDPPVVGLVDDDATDVIEVVEVGDVGLAIPFPFPFTCRDIHNSFSLVILDLI